MRDALHAADLAAYRFINGRLTADWLDPAVAAFTSSTFWAFALLVAVVTAGVLRKTYVLKVLVTLVAALALSDAVCAHLLKPAFARPRPCHALEDARTVKGVCEGSHSMPSGHASNSMAVATVIAFFGTLPWIVAGFVSAALVGLTRVYLGVHYPGDVLIGFVFGAAFGAIVSLLVKPFVIRRTR